MKIDLDSNNDDTRNHISRYSSKEITINNKVYDHNLILLPDTILTPWQVNPDTLSLSDFEDILVLQPEIILLGTGQTLIFPAAELIAAIQSLNIGFEVMDTPAACRCYNILLGENRKFAAAFIVNNQQN